MWCHKSIKFFRIPESVIFSIAVVQPFTERGEQGRILPLPQDRNVFQDCQEKIQILTLCNVSLTTHPPSNFHQLKGISNEGMH